MAERRLNPDYIAGVKEVLARAPFFHLIEMDLVELSPGRAVVRIPAQRKHLNPFGRVHGSVAAAAIDTATFWAVFSQVDQGLSMTTAELKLNFLAPAGEGMTLTARAEAIKTGRSLGLAEARLVEAGTGRLIAFGTATCMILDFPPPRALAALPPKFLD